MTRSPQLAGSLEVPRLVYLRLLSAPLFGGVSRGEGLLFTAFVFCRFHQHNFEISKSVLTLENTLSLHIHKNGDQYTQAHPQSRPRCRPNNKKRALRLNPARPSRDPLYHPGRHRRNSRCRHKSANREYLTTIPNYTITKTGEREGYKRFCKEDGGFGGAE